MAMTINSRKERVTVDGQRAVEYDLTFSDGAAADITALTSGMTIVSEVWVKAKTSGGTGIDVTTNNGTKITLDPVAAVSNVIVRVHGTDR